MLVALLIAVAGSAAPIIAPPVHVASSPAATKLITGFRSARFRMTPAMVRRAIASDFPGVVIAGREQPKEGTTVLEIVVPSIDPGPGPAIVSYVFGATTHTLAQITVSWGTKIEATPDERQAIAIAGLHLSDFLRTGPQPRLVLAPKVAAPGTISLYGALDADGAGVELLVHGVPYNSGSAVVAQPTGPAWLRVNYMGNPAHPDARAR